MNLNSILYSLGLSGMFSSRAFLPAFVTSAMMRWGDSIPGLKNVQLLQDIGMASTGGEPTWFTSGWAVGVLGLLSAMELFADKSVEMRELMDEFSVYAKTAISGLTTFGVMSAGDAQFVEGVVQQAGIFDLFPAIGSAGLTYFFSTVRRGTFDVLSEADSEDTLGIRSVLSWMEELWATFGVWILLYYTTGMLVLIGAVMGLLWLFQKRNEKKEEAAKVPCSKCGERIRPFATECHLCGTAVESPVRLSFLGKPGDERITDLGEQRLRLIELKRSPLSGARFEGRGLDIECAEDGARPFKDAATAEAYMGRIGSRLPAVLGLCLLLSFIPVLGLLVGVIYYRFQLVAPFRRYLPLSQGLVTKWMVRILLLVLISFQWVPGAGGVVVPLMALINYAFYRSAFRKALGKAGLSA